MKIPREERVAKKIYVFKEMELKWVGGGGVQTKQPSVGRVWIFPRTTQSNSVYNITNY